MLITKLGKSISKHRIIILLIIVSIFIVSLKNLLSIRILSQIEINKMLASIYGSLLGIILAIIAISITFQNQDNFKIVYKHPAFKDYFSINWIAIHWLFIASLWSIRCVILTIKSSFLVDNIEAVISLLLFLMVIIRVWKVVVVLRQSIDIISNPSDFAERVLNIINKSNDKKNPKSKSQ